MNKNKFPLNHKLVIKPTWFIQKDIDKLYDVERQEYMFMVHDKYIKKMITKRDYDVCVELLYHGLNINSLKDNKVYYDMYHVPIMNQCMTQIYKDIKTDEFHNFYSIIENVKLYIYNNLKICIENIANDLQLINIYLKNKKIHLEENIFFLCDDGNTITLSLNSYNDNESLGNTIKYIAEFSGESAQNDYNDFIKKYNIDSDIKISSKNTIGINTTPKIGNVKSVKLTRSIIIANKWFNTQNNFYFDMYKQLFEKDNINTFEYKFS